MCRAPARIFSHPSKVQFVAFCFALWGGKATHSLGLVLMEEEEEQDGGEVDEEKSESGRIGKLSQSCENLAPI